MLDSQTVPSAPLPDDQPIGSTPAPAIAPRLTMPTIRITRKNAMTGLLLIAIMLLGAYLRFAGQGWDDNTHLHPDERFLDGVASAIGGQNLQLTANQNQQEIPDDLKTCMARYPNNNGVGPYFDALCSTLYPPNAGSGLWVYGEFPLFITHYSAQIIAQITNNPNIAGYDGVGLVGRSVSALADTLTILFIFLIGHRLYGRWVGLLGALLYAVSVLPIQQSHFWTMDAFSNLPVAISFYFAARIMAKAKWYDFVAFGIAFGAAIASRINLLPLIGVGGLAALIYGLPFLDGHAPWSERSRIARQVVIGLVVMAAVSFVSFRLLNPHAFMGPSILGISPNPNFFQYQIPTAIGFSTGTGDSPPNYQWLARTPYLFPWRNIVEWGMGIPLGLMGWFGFLWATVQVIRARPGWTRHALFVAWIIVYFGYFGRAWVTTMRYFMPLYPVLAMLAAWALIEWVKRATKWVTAHPTAIRRTARIGAWALLIFVTGFSVLWGNGFNQIHTRLLTRDYGSQWVFRNLPAGVSMQVKGADNITRLLNISYTSKATITSDASNPTNFQEKFIDIAGQFQAIDLRHVLTQNTGVGLASQGQTTLHVRVFDPNKSDTVLATGQITADFSKTLTSLHGDAYSIPLDKPVTATLNYPIGIALYTDSVPLSLDGTIIAHEGDWDDPLPWKVCMLPGMQPLTPDSPSGLGPSGGVCNPIDGYGQGYYNGDYKLEMVSEDDQNKRNGIQTAMDNADVITISSNRFYDTLTRNPVRWPMTTAFYKALFAGQLGYSVDQTITSQIHIGPFAIPDLMLPNQNTSPILKELWQSEEAFSVYDHPPVFILKKTAAYLPKVVTDQLDSVNITTNYSGAGTATDNTQIPNIMRWPSLTANQAPTGLLLPPDNQAIQQAGGTFANLFPPDSPLNTSGPLVVIVWYLVIFLFGAIAWPLIYTLLPGLADRGYAIAKITGLLIVAWIVWVGGTLHFLTWSQPGIILTMIVLAIISIAVIARRRAEFFAFIRTNRRHLLIVEAITLALFILFLMVRLGNPDVWAQTLGGEKPMELSYFTAIQKSTIFPPYDPWFSGGFMNYYYFGYVLVGTPVKLLGIMPSIAFNLCIPTLFAMTGIGAFGVAYNLVASRRIVPHEDGDSDPTASFQARRKWALRTPLGNPYIAGVAAIVLCLLIGNLDTPREITQSLTTAGGYAGDRGGFTDYLNSIIHGISQTAQSGFLQISPERWYWGPTRILSELPGASGEIVEMPAFTYIFADMHPHMMDMPLEMLALTWITAEVLAAGVIRRKRWIAIGATMLGALAIGLTYATNTWDWYTYMLLGFAGMILAIVLRRDPINRRNVIAWVTQLAGFYAVQQIVSLPFRTFFTTSYNSVEAFTGNKTPLWAFFDIHGLFIFLILSLFIWQTVRILRRTYVRDLVHHAIVTFLILIAIAGTIVLTLAFGFVHISFWLLNPPYPIALICLPFMLWGTILFLLPDQSREMRIVLALMTLGVAIVFGVDVIVVQGDIGRQNTIFKFYEQVWLILSVACGVALAWLLRASERWSAGLRSPWLAFTALLIAIAGLFPVMATEGKVAMRMSAAAPNTLDGIEYMKTAIYYQGDKKIPLIDDYNLIKWMQSHISGSPVVLEAQLGEYELGSRITMNTGLPTILGYRFHQSQQRTLDGMDQWIWGRRDNVQAMYDTPSIDIVRQMLRAYNVRYIVVGDLEQATYHLDGLAKFNDMVNQGLLKIVYDDKKSTRLYEVLPQAVSVIDIRLGVTS